MALSRVTRGSSWALVLCALLIVGEAPAHASTIGVNEAFDDPAKPLTDWIFAGTTSPSVVSVTGQTPEAALRLTSSAESQTGFALYNVAIPTRQGLDIQFSLAQWGGSSGADGISFFVKDADNADNTPGDSGGALSYTRQKALPDDQEGGLPGGLFGIGFDSQGNYDQTGQDGDDCEVGTRTAPNVRNKISIRGPGQLNTTTNQWTNGYCLLAPAVVLADRGLPLLSNVDPATSTLDSARKPYTSRADATRVVRVVIDSALVANPKVRVSYGLTSATLTQVLEVDLPDEMRTVSNVKVGFAGATGGATNLHEIWQVTTAIANPEISASPEPPAAEPSPTPSETASSPRAAEVESAPVEDPEPIQLAATGATGLHLGFVASIVTAGTGVALLAWSRRVRPGVTSRPF